MSPVRSHRALRLLVLHGGALDHIQAELALGVCLPAPLREAAGARPRRERGRGLRPVVRHGHSRVRVRVQRTRELLQDVAIVIGVLVGTELEHAQKVPYAGLAAVGRRERPTYHPKTQRYQDRKAR